MGLPRINTTPFTDAQWKMFQLQKVKSIKPFSPTVPKVKKIVPNKIIPKLKPHLTGPSDGVTLENVNIGTSACGQLSGGVMLESMRQFKAGIFQALGHPTRVAIVEFLSHGEVSVGGLCEKVGIGGARLVPSKPSDDCRRKSRRSGFRLP
jgi:hypothetical protein